MPNLDFKQEWPTHPKVARHVLGLSNFGGGAMVIGMAERDDGSIEAVGLPGLTDKAKLTGGIAKYVPERLWRAVEILDFAFEESEYPALKGKAFQVLLAPNDPTHIPFLCTSDGEGIRKAAVYVRRGTSSEEASDEEMQNILNRRLETGYSTRSEIDLQTHLEQLKLLYSQIQLQRTRTIYPPGYYDNVFSRFKQFSTAAFALESLGQNLPKPEVVDNPHYPKESYEAFVGKLIRKKKIRIEVELGVNDLADPSG